LDEEQKVLRELNSPRFCDQAVREVWAGLLDEGQYLCSVRTMYRILQRHRQVRERRDQLRHPDHPKPELVANGPNQIWTWDITKLPGPQKWVYYSLYVILDIWSRYVVGWMVAAREAASLAARLIQETCLRQGIRAGQLTIHADRGSPMKGKPVVQLMAQLGVVPSHSRPRVSNDNPFSEAQFKTLKYVPEFPERFGSEEHAQEFCRGFFGWYNTEHHHTGIGLLTPQQVHLGQAPMVQQRRRQVLREAYRLHPERFVRGEPEPPVLPAQVWINPPLVKQVQTHAK
jgi:putative transposase